MSGAGYPVGARALPIGLAAPRPGEPGYEEPEPVAPEIIADPSRSDGLTMDSREIAELTGKQHAHVMRDIEEQFGRLEGGISKFGDTYRNAQNGQFYRCYKLPFRETMILVSGYSVELRARVVDRWLELEAKFKSAYPKPEAINETALRLLERTADLLARTTTLLDRLSAAPEPWRRPVSPHVFTSPRKNAASPLPHTLAEAEAIARSLPWPVSQNAFARALGISHATILNHARRLGITTGRGYIEGEGAAILHSIYAIHSAAARAAEDIKK
jgi:phage regulator Rha-like protein